VALCDENKLDVFSNKTDFLISFEN